MIYSSKVMTQGILLGCLATLALASSAEPEVVVGFEEDWQGKDSEEVVQVRYETAAEPILAACEKRRNESRAMACRCNGTGTLKIKFDGNERDVRCPCTNTVERKDPTEGSSWFHEKEDGQQEEEEYVPLKKRVEKYPHAKIEENRQKEGQGVVQVVTSNKFLQKALSDKEHPLHTFSTRNKNRDVDKKIAPDVIYKRRNDDHVIYFAAHEGSLKLDKKNWTQKELVEVACVFAASAEQLTSFARMDGDGLIKNNGLMMRYVHYAIRGSNTSWHRDQTVDLRFAYGRKIDYVMFLYGAKSPIPTDVWPIPKASLKKCPNNAKLYNAPYRPWVIHGCCDSPLAKVNGKGCENCSNDFKPKMKSVDERPIVHEDEIRMIEDMVIIKNKEVLHRTPPSAIRKANPLHHIGATECLDDDFENFKNESSSMLEFTFDKNMVPTSIKSWEMRENTFGAPCSIYNAEDLERKRQEAELRKGQWAGEKGAWVELVL